MAPTWPSIIPLGATTSAPAAAWASATSAYSVEGGVVVDVAVRRRDAAVPVVGVLVEAAGRPSAPSVAERVAELAASATLHDAVGIRGPGADGVLVSGGHPEQDDAGHAQRRPAATSCAATPRCAGPTPGSEGSAGARRSPPARTAGRRGRRPQSRVSATRRRRAGVRRRRRSGAARGSPIRRSGRWHCDLRRRSPRVRGRPGHASPSLLRSAALPSGRGASRPRPGPTDCPARATAATRPSMVCASASAATSSPADRAAPAVTGPMDATTGGAADVASSSRARHGRRRGEGDPVGAAGGVGTTSASGSPGHRPVGRHLVHLPALGPQARRRATSRTMLGPGEQHAPSVPACRGGICCRPGPGGERLDQRLGHRRRRHQVDGTTGPLQGPGGSRPDRRQTGRPGAGPAAQRVHESAHRVGRGEAPPSGSPPATRRRAARRRPLPAVGRRPRWR